MIKKQKAVKSQSEESIHNDSESVNRMNRQASFSKTKEGDPISSVVQHNFNKFNSKPHIWPVKTSNICRFGGIKTIYKGKIMFRDIRFSSHASIPEIREFDDDDGMSQSIEHVDQNWSIFGSSSDSDKSDTHPPLIRRETNDDSPYSTKDLAWGSNGNDQPACLVVHKDRRTSKTEGLTIELNTSPSNSSTKTLTPVEVSPMQNVVRTTDRDNLISQFQLVVPGSDLQIRSADITDKSLPTCFPLPPTGSVTPGRFTPSACNDKQKIARNFRILSPHTAPYSFPPFNSTVTLNTKKGRTIVLPKLLMPPNR